MINELIVFEENLTVEGLEKIQDEAEKLPEKIETKEQHKQIYEQHQRFKRLHVAIRKKAIELINDEKVKFEAEKTKIESDLGVVIGIIEPIRDKLGNIRNDFEEAEKAEKRAAAEAEAKRQQEEFERQQKIRDEQEAARQAELDRIAEEQARKEEELKTEQDRLARERYEFECEKSRLSFDDSWDDAIQNGHAFLGYEPEPIIDESSMPEVLFHEGEKCCKIGEECLNEFIHVTWNGGSKKKIEKVQDSQEDQIGDRGDNDPMDHQKERALRIKTESKNLAYRIGLDLEIGFVSSNLTSHLYTLQQTLNEFVNNFPEE